MTHIWFWAVVLFAIGSYCTKRTEIEEEIIANIEEAQLYLRRAESSDLEAGKCKSQIGVAIESLTIVETDFLENEYKQANTQLSSAKQAITDCHSNLKSSGDVQLGKAIMFLTEQALIHIQEAEKALSSMAKNETKPNEENKQSGNIGDSETCEVDGTICQFSKCAKEKELHKCAIGFAMGVTGGANGKVYIVTKPGDNPIAPEEGTLRYATSLADDEKTGVWITFNHDMVITLKDMLWVRSSTTIDGRGFNVTITGRQLVLAGVHNVIIHNIQVSNLGESDTIHIFAGSNKVWVDHVTSFNAKLGLVSVLQGSTDVTISNCHLSNPNFNMLLGASDADLQDQKMRVTVYRNWFKDSKQRMPHCRWGYCHVINNLYTNWGYYAIGARVHAKVKSESNVFIASTKTEITPWFEGAGNDLDQTATIESIGDLLVNGSTFHQFVQFGPASAPEYSKDAAYPPVKPTNVLADFVEKCAGALFGPELEACVYSS